MNISTKTKQNSSIKNATIRVITPFLFFLFFCYPQTANTAQQKNIIGETAWISIAGISVPYLARIDTGARITSIHAMDIQIEKQSTNPKENIGKAISFTTINRNGKAHTINGVIQKVSTVKNSQGTEQRYVIDLPLTWNHVTKTVAVNLRDRSQMTYKLLIGRNWLQHDFLVDVDLKAPKSGGTATNAN